MRRRSSAENSAPSSMPGGCWVPLLLVAAGVCDVSGCVYMCVCVYVCMYVCMYVCIRNNITYVRTYVCMYVCM